MSRRFHGSHHKRWNIEIDEDTIPPNASYWYNGANNSLKRLQQRIGFDEANKTTEEITGTWKEIYNAIEDLNEAAEKNRTVRESYDAPDPMAQAHSDQLQQKLSHSWGEIKEIPF